MQAHIASCHQKWSSFIGLQSLHVIILYLHSLVVPGHYDRDDKRTHRLTHGIYKHIAQAWCYRKNTNTRFNTWTHTFYLACILLSRLSLTTMVVIWKFVAVNISLNTTVPYTVTNTRYMVYAHYIFSSFIISIVTLRLARDQLLNG